MRVFLFLILIISINCDAQNITIKGKADASHIGKEVVLSDFSDYVTYTRTKESGSILSWVFSCS